MAEMIGPLSEVSDFVVRIRGIPWSCSKDEIVDFFNDCSVKNGTEGVHFVHAHESGKPSGEAFIELETSADVDKAKKHTMGYIGTRYIEVYDSTKDDMVFILNGGKRNDAKGYRKEGRPQPNFRQYQYQNDNFGFMANTCVRLRGLPFNCTEKDLYEFFEGIEIVPHGIKMPLDGKYRSVGEAYVKFATTADVDKAMSKHKEKIGHRYIELFRSNPREFDNCYVPGWTPPPRPGDRPPWMNDYGPRGPMNPYPVYDYGPRWNGGGSSDRPPMPPPSGHQYDYNYYGPPGPPPSFESNNWPPHQYHYPSNAPGPMRGPGRPLQRPVPYERPPPWATEPRPQEPHIKAPPYESHISPPPSTPAQQPPPPPLPVSKPLGNNFVFVRNLPHNVVEKDIDLFFRVKPTNVKIILDPYGRPEEANVAFATHEDAVKAMEQDKQLLFDKQVDLFLCSKEIPSISRQQKEPTKEEEAPNSNYNYAYSYKASPSNGSNGNENGNVNANPPVSSPNSQPSQPSQPQSAAEPAPTGEPASVETKTAQNNLSYFGMPPVRWPDSAALGTAATPVAYPPWSVPHYSQNGQYYGYAAYTYPVPTNPPATSSIRREPVNYTSR